MLHCKIIFPLTAKIRLYMACRILIMWWFDNKGWEGAPVKHGTWQWLIWEEHTHIKIIVCSIKSVYLFFFIARPLSVDSLNGGSTDEFKKGGKWQKIYILSRASEAGSPKNRLGSLPQRDLLFSLQSREARKNKMKIAFLNFGRAHFAPIGRKA